jgi:hypothetical protein
MVPAWSPSELAILIEQLTHTTSAKRRTSAKKLRALGEASAASALHNALVKEIKTRRTWETQYQMIMALATSCPAESDVSLLESILALPLEPMVHLAAGDALVRSSRDVDEAVLKALRSNSPPRAEGALRALAITRRSILDSTSTAAILHASSPAHKSAIFWAAAAAAGWNTKITRAFLESCLHDESAETRRAAEASLEGRYLSWTPL